MANEMQNRCYLRFVTKTVNEIDVLLGYPELNDEMDLQLETALTNLEVRWVRYEAAQATSLFLLGQTDGVHESAYDKAFFFSKKSL